MEELELNTILEKLEKSPMFHLSLSDKELFHSNMLAWIFVKYPRFFTSLFDLKEDVKLISVEREQNNFDLFITYKVNENDEKYILIENKVKSIPTQKQLDEYKEKNCKRDKAKFKDKTSYILLSFIKPYWFTDKNKVENWNGWSYLSYQKVAEKFNKSIEDNVAKVLKPYHKSLIEDYVKYINSLNLIVEYLKISEIYSLQTILLQFQDSKLNNRIFSLIKKWHFELILNQYSESIQNALTKNNLVDKWKEGKKGDYSLNTSIAPRSKEGMIDFKLITYSNSNNVVIFGIQIEGNQYRIVVETNSKFFNLLKIKTSITKSNLWLDLIDKSNIENVSFKIDLTGRTNKSNSKNLEIGEYYTYGDSFVYKFHKILETISKEDVINVFCEHIKQLNTLIDGKNEKFKAFTDKLE